MSYQRDPVECFSATTCLRCECEKLRPVPWTADVSTDNPIYSGTRPKVSDQNYIFFQFVNGGKLS